MLLTAEERQKFAAYLNQLADSDVALMKQLETMKVPAGFIEQHARMANARRLVAKDLLAVEVVEDGGTTG